jgi:hypothetical protein
MAQVNDFVDLMNAVLQDAAAELIVEIEQQGHNNTGKLVDSVEVNLTFQGGKIVGEVSALRYLDYINRPLKWTKEGPSEGQIDGLKAWWKAKGKSEEEAQSAAWAVAWNQIKRSKEGKVGMPSPNSFKFSKNGKRIGAIEAAFGQVRKNAPQTFAEALRVKIIAEFTSSLNREINRI